TVEKDDISHYHQATKFIREHYLDDISLENVAEALHISVRNLTRSFENRAYTVNGYILHLRLTKAREVLAFSDRPIRDIAYTLRFSCPKHFLYKLTVISFPLRIGCAIFLFEFGLPPGRH